jgi:hypothetical protein
VAPWDLEQQPAIWYRWALEAERAENRAQESVGKNDAWHAGTGGRLAAAGW